MVTHALKAEFQKKNLFYQYPNERVFYCCHWRWPRFIFVIIRVLLGLYVVYGMTHLVVNYYLRKDDDNNNVNDGQTTIAPVGHTVGGEEDDDDYHPSLMIYFTVWSYILLMLHFVLAAVLAVLFYKRAGDDICEVKFNVSAVGPKSAQAEMINVTKLHPVNGHSTPNQNGTTLTELDNPNYISSNGNIQNSNKSNSDAKVEQGGNSHQTYESFNRFQSHVAAEETAWYFRLSWCLSNIVSAAAPVVTIIFFTALYPQMDASEQSGLSIGDVNVHTLNLVFVVVDHAVSARPVRLLHCLAPVGYGLMYILFSVIYWSVDHERHVVYPGVLDWNYPGVAVGVTLGLGFVAIPLLQLTYFGVYHLKEAIHKKLYGVSFDGGMD